MASTFTAIRRSSPSVAHPVPARPTDHDGRWRGAPLDLAVTEAPGGWRLRVEGALVADTVAVLRNVPAVVAADDTLELDLRRLDRIDSCGIGAVFGLVRAARERDAQVDVLVGSTSAILLAHGLDRVTRVRHVREAEVEPGSGAEVGT